MDRLRNIKPTEARFMLRLANRLHATHDPIARKTFLVEGLCEMVRASGGSCRITCRAGPNDRQVIVSEVRYPATSAPVFDDGPSTDGCVAETNSENSVAAVADKVHLLDSTLQLADSTVTATVRICRSANRRKEFTPRAIAIVNFFHAEMNWIYQADIVLTSADAMALAPRARQTLELLLAGLGEKQIASKLGLSPNTVHHYVKSIHRHFGVSSRSELLARWVGK